MTDDQLHPTVREFKYFMNRHPMLIREVRRSGRQWQEYYEKWALLGENDPMWEQYKEKTDNQRDEAGSSAGKGNKTELLSHVMKLTQYMDMNKIQTHVEQLSNTIATIQEMIGHFQANKSELSQEPEHPEPFNLFRD